MTVRALSERIYEKLNIAPTTSKDEIQLVRTKISDMLDKLFSMYPIYWQALILSDGKSKPIQDIIDFCSSELNKPLVELEEVDFSSILSRFILKQSYYLSIARNYSFGNDYDINAVDTTNFTPDEHEELLSVLNRASGLLVSLKMPSLMSDELLGIYCEKLSRFYWVSELKLTNFPCNEQNIRLIRSLSRNSSVMLKLPDWDIAEDCAEKVEYYKLQNNIQNNRKQSKARDAQVAYESYRSLPFTETKSSDRDCINIAEAKVASDIKTYQFSKNISIQQEHQVQIQHEHSHQIQNQRQQEQQQEFQAEDSYELDTGSEELLITRENIELRFRPYWDYLCKCNAELPGWQSIDRTRDLGEMLSLFLGGFKEANFVAFAIKPEALMYIMQRAPQFLNAFVYDIPPAGIEFKRSKSCGKLVVSFNKDLEEHAQQGTINPALLPKEFVGGNQQFYAFTSTSAELPILDRYLATRDGVIEDIDPRYDFTVFCGIIKKWALANSMVHECADYLFNNFTPANAKSLGQLFNDLDFKELQGSNNEAGTKRWIDIVNFIWSEDKENFSIWKQAVLDTSMHWAECITAAEDFAIQESINTLKNSTNFKSLWWQVILAHSNTCGYTSYARVWGSYFSWMTFIQENNLERYVDLGLFTTYMQETKPFDGKAFLDRMIWVLQRPKLKLVSASENRSSSKENTISPAEIQAHILMNIREIDWGHEGFYYASRYDGYIAWMKNLLFSNFEHASSIGPKNQFVTYKSTDEEFTTIKTFARRYASLYLNLTPLEWKRFEQGLNSIAPDELFESQSYELVVTDYEPDATEDRSSSQIIVSPTSLYFYCHIEKAFLNIQPYDGQVEELRNTYTESSTELSPAECAYIIRSIPLQEHITLSVSIWIRCLACGIDRDNLSDNSKPLPKRLEMYSDSDEALRFIASIIPLQESSSVGDFLWPYDEVNHLSRAVSNMDPQSLRGMKGLDQPRRWVNSLIRVLDSSKNAEGIQDLDHPSVLQNMYDNYTKPDLDIYPWLYNNLAPRVRPCYHAIWVRDKEIELDELSSYKHPCYILLKSPDEDASTCNYYYYDPDLQEQKLSVKEVKLSTLTSAGNNWWYSSLTAYARLDYNTALINKVYYTTGFYHTKFKVNQFYSKETRVFLSDPKAKLEDSKTHQFSIDRFEMQLKSISCRNVSFLPSAEQVIAAYKYISKKGEKARKEVIAEWLQQGCAISVQFASSLLLEEDTALCRFAKENFTQRLSRQYSDVNRQLFFTLLPYLAYDNRLEDTQQKVLDFIDAIQALDRNDSFNELGHLLRMFVRVATKKGVKHYYAIENLTGWITALTDESKPLFPLNLMETVLSEEIEDCKSVLINKDLEQLHSEQRTNISEISELAKNQGLPYLVKINLAKLAYRNLRDFNELLQKWLFISSEKVSPQYLIDVSNIVLQKQNFSDDIVEQITHSISNNTPKYLIESQETLADLLNSSRLSPAQFEGYFKIEKPFTEENKTRQAILLQAMQQDSAWESVISNVNQELQNWDLGELIKLAKYCNHKPKPSMADLDKLVGYYRNDTSGLIHHYETKIQTWDVENNTSKRDLSLTPENAKDITRIISGIKRKDSKEISNAEKQKLLRLFFYTNAYSLTIQDLNEHDLIAQLHKEAKLSRESIASGNQVTPEAQARILACQREILVRKSGKWCNRMQMIDLLYSAIHNEDGLLHQIRTGGGKSLIALMRMSYRALMGEVVGFYSAKTVLAFRDYNAYRHVLDVMFIKNSYVSPKMEIKDIHYKPDHNGIGAINFGTGSTFILAENKWKQRGELPYGYESKQRGAYVDEFHNVCKDTTQCNSPDDTNAITNAFNPDVWIYEVAYEYFTYNIARFEGKNWTFDNQEDLPGLDKALRQREVELFSESSNRLINYVARENGDEGIQKRDRALTKLLRAAYTAHYLVQDVKSGFSIWENVEKRIGGVDGEILIVSQAKVLIDNQVSEDSTFRDLVHQLLDVRLNKAALANGLDQVFLVDPVQTVALSQNMLDRLRKYHQRGSKIEGCTATSGRTSLDLRFYAENFGINHVPKLPNDKPLRTTIHAPAFCRGEAAMAEALKDITSTHQHQPILALCPDDSAVKFFTGQLSEHSHVIPDTNDGKLSENEVIRNNGVGEPGVITLSSRMGQGTDIEMSKQLYDDGLVVVTIGPRERLARKQARGRQGRMGFAGDVCDIYDMDDIDLEWGTYLRSHASLLEKIYKWERRHLDEKMAKHETRITESETTGDWIQNDKWAWAVDNQEHAEYYLKDRAIALLIEHIEKQEKTHTIAKDRFLNELSQYVGMVFNSAGSEDRRQELKRIWLEAREKMEALWSDHQAGFADYLTEAVKELETIKDQFPRIQSCYTREQSLDVLADFEQVLDSELELPDKCYESQERIIDPALPAIQGWLSVVQQKFAPQARATMFGEDDENINEFFIQLSESSPDWLAYFSNEDLPRVAGMVPCAAWTKIIKDTDNFALYQELLAHFFDLFANIEDFDIFAAGIDLIIRQVNLNSSFTHIKHQLAILSEVALTLEKDPREKRNHLMQLLINIIEKLPPLSEQEEHVRTEFFKSLAYIFQQDFFWDMDCTKLYSLLKDVITTTPDVLDLFTRHISTGEQLTPILMSIYKSLEFDDDEKIEFLKQYIIGHVSELQEFPEVLEHVFSIILSENENALPNKIQCLPEDLPKDAVITFWKYLASRNSINEDNLNKVLEWLNTGCTLENIEALANLPDSISFAYLASQTTSFLDDKSSFISLMHATGVVYEAFLQKGYDKVVWDELFMSKDVNYNNLFFTNIYQDKYNNIHSLLLQFVHRSALIEEQSEWILDLGARISRTDKSNDLEFIHLITSFISESVEGSREKQFIECLFSDEQSVGFKLANESINKLFNVWCRDTSMDTPSLLRYANIEIKIADLDEGIKGYINNIINSQAAHNLKEAFVNELLGLGDDNLIDTNELKNLSLSSLEALWSNFQNGTIQTNTALRQYIDLNISTARSFELFKNYMLSSESRSNIIKALKEDSMIFSEEKRVEYYGYYRQRFEDITTWVNLVEKSMKLRAGSYKLAYQQLNHLCNEIQLIKSPSNESSEEMSTRLDDLRKRYRGIFDQHKEIYNGFFWSCNRTRLNQAKSLFSALDKVSARNKVGYYTNVLQVITDMQKQIFEGDKSYYFYASNKKGYSRLHHICTELFLTVAKDVLCDPDLSEDEKLLIQERHNQQVKEHVILLSQQVKGDLYNKLAQWSSSDVDLNSLSDLLRESSRQDIPKTIHYLYDSLLTMAELESNQGKNMVMV